MFLAMLVGLSSAILRAQDIQQVYQIPLETIAFVDGASTYYKYGINIGIGGGTAQTFEFDTGGEGFYAAYAPDSWWGPKVGPAGESFTKTFGSNISYGGNVVTGTGLAFYSVAGSSSPILNLGNTFAVGKADTITQDSTTLWSGTSTASSPPPVQGAFYGDFGLSLKKGAHGVENVFAQLSYGNGVSGGYIVSTGTYGSPNGTGTVQVGLTQADLTNPNTTWFTMSGSSSEMFTGSNFHTFAAELLTAKVKLSTESGDEHGFAIGVNLDTGNPTPGIDYKPEDGSILAPFSTDGRLSNNVTLEIEAVPTSGGSEQPVLQFPAGDLYGQNLVYEKERSDGGDTYLNIGTKLFQEYQVTYDLENGRIGFTPYAVPEPGTWALLALGAALAGVHRLRRAKAPAAG